MCFLKSEKGGRQRREYWIVAQVELNKRQWQTKEKYNGCEIIVVEYPVKNFDTISLGHRHSAQESKSTKLSK